MSTRRSRSSPTSSSSARSTSAGPAGPGSNASWPSASCLRSTRRRRRSSSSPRFLAAVISHAPGLSGMPVSGQRSSASTSASCARSSARPTSRTSRTRPPSSRADSTRQTASMAFLLARLSTCGLSARCSGRRLADLAPEPLVEGTELGGDRGAEVVELVERADFELRFLARHRVGAAARPLEGLVERAHLPEPVPRDELLRLGERAVHRAALSAGEADALPMAARLETVAGEHDTRLHELFVELAHASEQLLTGHHAGLGVLRRLDHHHDSHRRVPSGVLEDAPVESDRQLLLPEATNRRGRDRQPGDL